MRTRQPTYRRTKTVTAPSYAREIGDGIQNSANSGKGNGRPNASGKYNPGNSQTRTRQPTYRRPETVTAPGYAREIDNGIYISGNGRKGNGRPNANGKYNPGYSQKNTRPVSYTHLTLPTIYSV